MIISAGALDDGDPQRHDRKMMTTRKSTSRSLTVSAAGWPKGMYVVNVTVNKEVMTRKVVVNSMNGNGS